MTQKETNLYVVQKSWITFIQRKVINLRNYYECLMIKIVLILFISKFIPQSQNDFLVDILSIHSPLPHIITGNHQKQSLADFR